MLRRVLEARIRDYGPVNALEQENVLQEIMQHYVLAGLSRSGLFSDAMFHGGTCLRIVHGMSRFSEDLDFLLKKPDPNFEWQRHLDAVGRDCESEGIHFDVLDKSAAAKTVRKAFLKTDSIGKILTLDLPFERHANRKIRIKLEIDTNPPRGSDFSTSYITFPVTAPLTTQTLESGFALKLHALLCRGYVKGRDWYDLVWYVSRRTRPHLPLLADALRQQGPWAGQDIDVSPSWLRKKMEEAIRRIDWPTAKDDVRRFLPQREQEGLAAWTADFFLYHLARISLFEGERV